jgi:hypothetical protein
MRLALGLLASTMSFAMVACGGGGGDDDGVGDDDSSGTPDAGDDPPPPENGFQLVSPDIEIASGEEVTYCWYTTIDIDQAVGVKKWSSTMTPGSHHLIVYFTGSEEQPDDTITQDCGGFGAGLPPVWTYSAQTPEAENPMPAGVGMTVNAQQKLFVQMHYLNVTPNPISAHVVINAETYAEGEQYEPASPYITFNTEINLGPMEAGSVEGTCDVPAGKKFFTLSTHAHRRATRTYVMDGDTMLFDSDNWEHPGATDWRQAPYYEFNGALTYHCDYQNDLDQPVTTGDSADTDEMCMAVGYMFPATSPTYCLNSQTF